MKRYISIYQKVQLDASITRYQKIINSLYYFATNNNDNDILSYPDHIADHCQSSKYVCLMDNLGMMKRDTIKHTSHLLFQEFFCCDICRENNCVDAAISMIKNNIVCLNRRLSINGLTPLIVATIIGKTKLFDQIIENKNIFIDADDANGRTAFYWAVKKDNVYFAKKLIRLGCRMESYSYISENPLILAIRRNNPRLVRMMIKNGADCNIRGKGNGLTALMVAIDESRYYMIDLLIRGKCNLSATESVNGMTALMMAAKKGLRVIVKKLIDAECDLDQVNNFGGTALIMAGQKKHYEVVRMLISAGCDVSVKNYNGESICDYIGQ